MNAYIMNDIITAVRLYLPTAFLVGIEVIVCLYLLQNIFKDKGYKRSNRNAFLRLFLLYFFVVYCYMVVAITYLSRLPGSIDQVDLAILSSYNGSSQSLAYMIENILLFLPFGYLLPALWERFNRVMWMLGMGFSCSLVIEISQHLSERGYFQVDDLILNILGTIIGYIVFCIQMVVKHYKYDVRHGKTRA